MASYCLLPIHDRVDAEQMVFNAFWTFIVTMLPHVRIASLLRLLWILQLLSIVKQMTEPCS